MREKAASSSVPHASLMRDLPKQWQFQVRLVRPRHIEHAGGKYFLASDWLMRFGQIGLGAAATAFFAFFLAPASFSCSIYRLNLTNSFSKSSQVASLLMQSFCSSWTFL